MKLLRKASFLTFVCTLSITGANFLTSMMTARQLGPQGRGSLAAFVLVATLAAGASQLGLPNAYIYFRRLRPLAHLGGVVAVGLLLAATLGPLAALALGGNYGSSVFEGQHGMLLTLAALTAVYSYCNTLSQSRDGLVLYNLGRSIVPLGLLLVAGVVQLGHASAAYPWYVTAQAVLSALAIGIMLAGLRTVFARRPADATRVPLKELLPYALKHHGNVLVALVVMNIDKIFVLHKVPPREFGFYALSYSTTRLLATAQDSLSTSLYSRHAGRDEAELSAAVRRVFRMTLLPMLGVAAAAAAAAPWIIEWVFGPPYRPMAAPFALLAFESVIGAASWTLTQRLLGGGRPGVMLLRNVSLLLLFLALFSLLPASGFIVALAGLMLVLAVLRLAFSMAVFPWVLKEPLPSPWPQRADWQPLLQAVRRRAGGA